LVANPDDTARAERAALHQPLRDLPVGDGPVAVSTRRFRIWRRFACIL
jgi:hypothetical protein